MSSDYCRDCDGKMSCNNYHVYVIELDRAVLEEKPDFPYEGNLPNDKKIFYVGITKHRPECRYLQHTAERPENNEYLCNCFSESPTSRKFPKKVKYVHGFDLNLARISPINPIVRTDGPTFPGSAIEQENEAKNKEMEMGEKLRKLGHAVYWN